MQVNWLRRCARIVCLVALIAFGAAQTQPNAQLPSGDQVVAYLNQTLDWHRQISVEEQLTTDPADTLFVSDSRQIDLQIVRLSFDFARADAALVAKAPATTSATPSRYQSLQKAAAAAETEMKQTQAELQGLRQKIGSAPAKQRRDLQSQIDELQSELALAQTRYDTLKQMTQFVSGAGAAGGGLVAQIDELQRSVPEAAPVTNNAQSEAAQTASANSVSASAGAAAATGVAAAAKQSRRQQPSGILDLATNLIELHRKVAVLNEAIGSTDALAQSSKSLRSPLVTALTSATQQGETLAKEADTANTSELEALKAQLDALTTNFRQYAGVVLPLGKQSILIESYRGNLVRWRDTVRSEYDAEFKSFAIRIAVFLGILAIVFAVGEVWRRFIFRYVHDIRRRYQFLLLRRILLWCVVGIVVAFALASEIGSIATFAGLITAGLAVALQNVILAIAGYFFLIGKYGVRVGDRVQISGITGDVVDVGLIRLHLMEIGGSGSDRHATGRVVVFSNSIVFQPTASFFKQIPGTSLAWHEVTLVLAPDTNYRAAEERMLSAVQKVFEEYRENIERQHRTMEATLNMPVAAPKPISRLHLTQTGLEVSIRYPVETDSASDVDDKITRELLRALDQPPKLRVVGSGTPNIQPVESPNQNAA